MGVIEMNSNNININKNKSRRDFLRTMGKAGLALPLAGTLRAAESWGKGTERPNILLIMLDDVGREALGCYGGESYKTPRIDRLAAAGMRFEHVYSAPVYHPTRICLMTGQYPFRLGNPKWGTFPARAEMQTFAHELKKAGYATAIAGKWQIAKLEDEPDHPHRLGFDEYCLFGWHEGPRYHEPRIWQNGRLREDVKDRYGPDVYADFLIDFMRRHKNKENSPFFAYHSMALSHAVSNDLDPPPPYGPKGRYDNFGEMMEQMDRIVGKIIDAVDDLGLKNETVILFTSDNGTAHSTIIRHENGEYLSESNFSMMNGVKIRGGKKSFNDWGTRVPTIARWPGKIPAGSVSSDLIDFSDFLPTLNAMADRSKPDFKIDGHSFAGMMTGGAYTPREWVYTEHEGTYWIRSKNWKLYNDGRFYDLVADPEEQKPLDSNNAMPKAAEARKKLSRTLKKLRKS